LGVKNWNQGLQQQLPLLPAKEQIPGTIFSAYTVSFPKTRLTGLVKNLNPWNWVTAVQIPLEGIFPFWNCIRGTSTWIVRLFGWRESAPKQTSQPRAAVPQGSFEVMGMNNILLDQSS
jgi:hypothetical protein